MPGFALNARLIKIRANYSDKEFFRDLLVASGTILTGGIGLGAGAGSIAARGFIGRLATQGAIKLKNNAQVFIGALFAEIARALFDYAKSDIDADAALKALIYETTGLELDGFTAEDAKRAIGKKLAADLNAYYGTNFDSLYPLDTMITEIKSQIVSELITAVANNAPPPSSFKFLSNAAARDITNQIINRYRIKHGLPTVASGVVLPSTPQRVKNKISQANYRANNTRFSEWRSDDNATILNHYQSRLQALRVAKKAYRAAASAYAKVLSSFNAGVASGVTLPALLADKNAKLAIFNAAQQLGYTGDGTTL